MAMQLLQCARTMTCLWIWLLEVWCGCGASYACAPVSASYSLFNNVMITFILIDGAAAMTWCGILLLFPCLDLGGCWVVDSLWVAYHVVVSGCWAENLGL